MPGPYRASRLSGTPTVVTDASPEGQRLASQLDGTALSDAVKRGDAEALKNMLGQVLSTPEGRALAEKVQKAIGNK